MASENVTCPRGTTHYLVCRDDNCGDCGSVVVHGGGAGCGGGDAGDYAVWCTNPECKRHACHEVYDTDCPDWAHGRHGEED